MIATTLLWIADKVKGTLKGEDQNIKGVSTDTRTLQPGDLYIALCGENFNGHRFISSAEQAGASAVIASEPVKTSLPVISVSDTKQALGLLGAAVKQRVAPATIAITGSSGKTTVKEMTSAILSCRGKVLATAGNFNNDIGVPLTLLRLEAQHDFAVIELGANHAGEIGYTTQLVKPDVATIVNAAASHLEGFGSTSGVAEAKSEIFEGLSDTGVAIINGDSEFASMWQSKVGDKKVLTFSPEQKTTADFNGADIQMNEDGCAQFTLQTPAGNVAIKLAIPGVHNVGNALVAAALSLQLGATLDDVAAGLNAMTQVKGRLNSKLLTAKLRLLDDTYNANVASVMAAMDTLASFTGTRVFILGDMAELGENARQYHEQVGQYARTKGIDYLFTMGVLSQQASNVYGDKGAHFTDMPALIDTLDAICAAGKSRVSVLVKGSRSARMERVVDAIEGSRLGKNESRRERVAC
ncbi:UDP-N-acetylmuramoyl-tripeptide--D-alanyl-D-alanine ligase [Alteromonas sp. C1M14]|uniref:UDP-N-acetylmuramoyl-tripeptide--D-alanyl-D- alanine ligase n=1 Tax=Alteromonas sp. C1M14 TaxID=2841567 RepID=UPI001C09C1D7|nr:UDP-N-acetylmuramoyl-tripeptide--D-alanyl-D-alanine ligase [Alteromonas sp. C1M14]MBU2979419.1 UDP-N-acetylmuramoyl-tripeptide--D-alanyl-D-alanine ligase [Alteromonas sp. C1M14]